MPQVIGALVALILIVYAIMFVLGALVFLLTIAFYSSFAWGTGLAVGYAVIYFYRHSLIGELSSPATLSKLVGINFDGSKLACSIYETELEQYSNATSAKTFAVMFCAAITGAILWFQNYKNSFAGLKFLDWPVSNTASMTSAIVFSVVVIIVTLVRTGATLGHKTAITQEVDRLLNQANFSLKGIDELQAILQKIVALAQTMRIDFSEDTILSIRSYIDTNKADILSSTEKLESLIASKIIEAKANLTEFERASDALNQVMQLHFHAASAANQVGSPTMFQYLDQLLIGIEGLKTFLSKKEWQGFHKGIEFVTDKLKIFLQNANNYSETPETVDTKDASMNPYEALHVPEDITEEQLIKFWKSIRSVYHPDKGMVNEDEDRHYIKVREAVMEIVTRREFDASKFRG